MDQGRRRRRARGRPPKLIPGGGVAAEIADLAIALGVAPGSLLDTPVDILVALYDGLRRRDERRRRHGHR
jgi:hypothetical protein